MVDTETTTTTPLQEKTTITTPASGETNETEASSKTWYSYFSKENQREFYHEPISNIVSWVAPNCGPSGSPILREGNLSGRDPAANVSDDDQAMELQHVKPTPTFQRRLGYFGAALLATNVVLMLYARHSLEKAMAIECEPCPPVPEAVPCTPVACTPVDCAPVDCTPVPCEPTEPKEPVCAACPPPTVCDPCPPPDCTPPAEVQAYVQQVLTQNAHTLELVQQRVRAAAPQGFAFKQEHVASDTVTTVVETNVEDTATGEDPDDPSV